MGPRVIDDDSVPVRATYFKWPESDAEFMKSIISGNVCNGGGEPKVVDSFTCRQLYVRSYTFSRKEESAVIKCLGRIKDKIKRRSCGGGGRKSGGSIFRRLVSCTTIKI